MKDKANTINYKEIGIFILVLLAIIFILLKVVPVNFRYGILIAVGISMIIMPMTKKKLLTTMKEITRLIFKLKQLHLIYLR